MIAWRHDQHCRSAPDRPLHDHLVGLPRRRQPRDLPRVPHQGMAGRVRRLAREVLQPVPRPAGRRAEPQLGRRASRRRPPRRRHRRRSHVSQHGPAVLPHRRGDRRGTDARQLRASPRRHPRAQPLAGRLLQRATGPARRARADLPQRHRRRGRRHPLGQGARAAQHPAARGRAQLASRPAVRARVRPGVARVRGDGPPGHRALRWHRHAELRQVPDRQPRVRARVVVLFEPFALAPADVGRLRTLPDVEVRHDRAGQRVGPRACSIGSTTCTRSWCATVASASSGSKPT